MEEKDFNQTVDETVNFFMNRAAQYPPEVVYEMAMGVFMNLLAILPYPVMRQAEGGGAFPEEYRKIVMKLIPEFTASMRGYAGEFIQNLILKATEKGLIKDGEFEFLGRNYGAIPDPPTEANN